MLASALTACGPSSQDVAFARVASYDGPFDTVFATTRDRIARDYPLQADPVERRLATRWIQIELVEADPHGPVYKGSLNAITRNFVRFDIDILGGPPWIVDVRGHASTWKADDAKPYVYPEAERPPFLESRESALVLAIHNALERCCRRRR